MRSGFDELALIERHLKGLCINMIHAVASYLCRDIEVVITGLTRNQFVSNHTRVRIPLSAPKRKSILQGGFFVWRRIETGFERREQNNLNGCFENGDRRILQSITLNSTRNALQNSRTNPSLCTKVVKSAHEGAVANGEKHLRQPLFYVFITLGHQNASLV